MGAPRDRAAFVRDVRRYAAVVRLGYAVVLRPGHVREVLVGMVALGPPWVAGAVPGARLGSSA